MNGYIDDEVVSAAGAEDEVAEGRAGMDRRALLARAGKAGAGLLIASALGGLEANEAKAWSFNPASYTTPIAGSCFPVSQWYGPNTKSHTSGENAAAIDIACPTGTLVYAPKDGVISFEGWEGKGGIVVRINHADGLQSVLAHLSWSKLWAGDRVRGGYTLIGHSGATGNVSGAHLHWHLRVQGSSRGIWLDQVPGVSKTRICP